MIALSAVVAGWQAIDRLLNPHEVSNLGWVAAAGVVGFAGNELVAQYRIRVGRRIGSAALLADGLHARTDGFTSLAVVAGAAGVAAGWRQADPVIGLVITVAILAVLRTAARDIYRRLMDAVDPALIDAAETALAGEPGVLAMRSVRMRWIGHELHAEASSTSTRPPAWTPLTASPTRPSEPSRSPSRSWPAPWSTPTPPTEPIANLLVQVNFSVF